MCHLVVQNKVAEQHTGAALCNAHGQCNQIFAKVGDGRLQQ